MRTIYIGAPRNNVGKTTASLVIVSALTAQGYKCRYMKPVCQKGTFDADMIGSFLQSIGCTTPSDKITFLTIDSNMTNGTASFDYQAFRDSILSCIDEYEKEGVDFLVVEGMGHVATGHVLSVSSEMIIRLLSPYVLIIVPAGRGKVVDDFYLCEQYLLRFGTHIDGIIINNVDFPAGMDAYVSKMKVYLGSKSINCVGCIPRNPNIGKCNISKLLKKECPELSELVDNFDADDWVKLYFDLHDYSKDVGDAIVVFRDEYEFQAKMDDLNESSYRIVCSNTTNHYIADTRTMYSDITYESLYEICRKDIAKPAYGESDIACIEQMGKYIRVESFLYDV